MAEIYGPFNSVNHDRRHDADDLAKLISQFFTNGVFNNTLQVVSNNNMTITVKIGSAHINGRGYINDEDKILDIAEADNTLSRIDSVVVRFDKNNRQITSQIIQGSYATNPSQPNITRNENIYDLRIANISIPAGTNRITTDLITDTRFTNDCGNVTQAVLELDTEGIFKQYEALFYNWFNQIQTDFEGDVAGNLDNKIIEIASASKIMLKTLGLWENTFSNTKTYNVDDLVVYDHRLYCCIQKITTAGTWDSTKWKEISILVNESEV